MLSAGDNGVNVGQDSAGAQGAEAAVTRVLLAILLVLPAGGCSKTPEQVVRSCKVHLLRLEQNLKSADSVAAMKRLTVSYGQKHRSELATLREDAGKLARDDDRKAQLAARAYCLLWLLMNQKEPTYLKECLVELRLGL